MQYKEVTGYFCKPAKLSTFRISKGENSLTPVFYPRLTRGQGNDGGLTTSAEEKRECAEETDDEEGDDDDDAPSFPDRLKYIYAITCLPFSKIRRQLGRVERRPTGQGTKLKNLTLNSGGESRSGLRQPSPPPDSQSSQLPSSKADDDYPIAFDGIFVLNRDLSWLVLAYIPHGNTFKVVLQGKLKPPRESAMPRNDGIVTMDAGFLHTLSSENYRSMNYNSSTPSKSATSTSNSGRRVAVYLSIFDIPCVTRLFIDCPKELLLSSDKMGSEFQGRADKGTNKDHDIHTTLLNSRPATVTASENFIVAWDDPGIGNTAIRSGNSRSQSSGSGAAQEVIDRVRILGVQHVPNKFSNVLVLYQNIHSKSIYIRNAIISARHEQLVDGPWFAGPLDPTTVSFVDWPVQLNHLCVGTMSASLFNADGLAGYVEFDEETHRKLIKCELDSVKHICKFLKLHEEPFETAIPKLIDRCHDRYMYLMQNDAAMTNESEQSVGSNCRLRRTVGVIGGFEIPLLMTPSSENGKQPAGSMASRSHQIRKRLLVASHGADANASGHLCYTEWGKRVDVISEIRADEHGFGHPDIFSTKDAIFLSYRAENQTHVLPLTEDGEIYEYDPDTEYTQEGKLPISIPSFYSDATTLCVGRIPNSALTVQITTGKIGIFRDGEDQAIEEWVSFENAIGRRGGGNDEIRFASLHLTDTTSPRGMVIFDSDVWIFELSTSNDPSTFLNRIHFTFNVPLGENTNQDLQISTASIWETYILIGVWNDSNNIYLYDIYEATLRPSMQADKLENYEKSRFKTAFSSSCDAHSNTEIKSVDGDQSCSAHDGDVVRSFAMTMKCRYLFAGTMYGRVYCFDLQTLKTPDASNEAMNRNQSPIVIGKWQVGNEVVHLRSFLSIPMIYASSNMDAIISFLDADGCLLSSPNCDLICRPRDWISSMTRPVASPQLDGSLIVTVSQEGNLIFSSIDHHIKWQEQTGTVMGSITGLSYVESSHIVVLTTDQSVQFWDSDIPQCITIHQSPNESRVTAICSHGKGSVAVAIFHNGVTAITLFEVVRKVGGEKTALANKTDDSLSVIINPIARGEIDGVCLKLASVTCDKRKSVLYAVVDEHILHLKVRGKDISIGNVQRSMNGRSIMALASSTLALDFDSTNTIDGSQARNGILAAGETLGPIFAIVHHEDDKTEMLTEKPFNISNEDGLPQRMVTAMKIISFRSRSRNDSTKCYSWKIVAADRISNTVIVVVPVRNSGSEKNSDNVESKYSNMHLVVERKITSNGIRIASFVFGSTYFGGLTRNDTLLCVQNDGSTSELRQKGEPFCLFTGKQELE